MSALFPAVVEAAAHSEDPPSRGKRQAASQSFVVELLLVIDYGVYEL